ncbi:PilZ domain-containing protein [Lachnotalea glycerini]|uniref:PilZ domain-containing protein n=1 Tax=Lachnotalea glycerini TaxID=1763509 RepID=A0A255I3V6_9FIRM|nr:PilZ domain-containing protein [Lachnotalea glycerini]PXV93632.1 PilZ domain-containing protein [Lachnotalea glycerini]RDY32580.1 PilZ domain-containing protein [Lachnotalea glycerini]
MKLVDLAENTKLQIEVSFKGSKLFYETQVKLTAHEGVFIAPIRQDDKMIDFNAGNLMINVTADIDGTQPILWRECTIKAVKYKKEVFHMITSKRGGLQVNRRGRFRIDMGYTGTARVGFNKGTLNVVVHDISGSGFSFTTEKNLEDLNEEVHIVFIDTDNDTRFNLIGKLVRKQEWNNNRFLYGCKFQNINKMVEYYIAKKQREIISLNSINKKNIIELRDEK